MSDFPSLHRDEIANTVELKTCERCSGLFTKQGDVHFCPRCVNKHNWLAEGGSARRTFPKTAAGALAERPWDGMDLSRALAWWDKQFKRMVQ